MNYLYRYTKPLVASASLSDQRYNPEVTGVTPDTRVAALGDKLRQVRQVRIPYVNANLKQTNQVTVFIFTIKANNFTEPHDVTKRTILFPTGCLLEMQSRCETNYHLLLLTANYTRP